MAHDSIVWTLAWHPLGHILCSGSNDHTVKFWTRNRPGDQMRDKYNLNTLPASLAGLDECELEEHIVIPGMGPEDKVDIVESIATKETGPIPGLDLNVNNFNEKMREKKIPYSKPIPRNFQAQWNEAGALDEQTATAADEIKEVISQLVDGGPVAPKKSAPLPTAISLYNRTISVIRMYCSIWTLLSWPERFLRHFLPFFTIPFQREARWSKQLQMEWSP